MQFINKNLTSDKIVDGVFKIAELAKNDTHPETINATIGSLYDEDNQLVAFKSFYHEFNNLSDAIKAKYAESFSGNQAFNEAVIKHVTEDKLDLHVKCLATSGGTGGIAMTFKNILEAGQTILLPSIAWGSYALMAKEFNLKVVNYDIFNIDDLITKAEELAKTQDKLLIVINSPCHNPTGISYDYDTWHKLIEHLNVLNIPVVILNDIAYIDYSANLEHSRDYLKAFNSANENILVNIAFSLSKTMTSYGLRTGALLLVNKNEKLLDNTYNAFEKSCRVLWSNVNNAAMVAFAKTMSEDKDAFLKEKALYVNLLTQRAELFLSEAKACDLATYPYQEGFFITLKMDDNAMRDIIHTRLMEHHIYTVKVEKGIRLSICSISLPKLKGLAERIKAVY